MAFDLASAQPVQPDSPDSKSGFDLASAKPVEAPKKPSSATDWVRGAGDAALSMGKGMLKGAMTDIADLDPIEKEREEQKAKIEKRISTTPTTEEGKKILGGVNTVLEPVNKVIGAVGDVAHKGIAAVAGERTANVVGDVTSLVTNLVGGEELTAAKGIRAATKGIKATQLSADAAKAADAAAAAQKAGYVLPSRMANPSKLHEITNYAVGKESLNDAMSARNQSTTNGLVKQALGVKSDAPLDQATLQGVRNEAGKAYEEIRNLTDPNIKTGAEYTKALDKIGNTRKGGISKARADDPIVKMVDELKSNPNFTTDQALNEIRSLRNESDKHFRQGDKALAKSFKDAAGVVENAIEDHLKVTKAPADLVKNFKDARQRIAQSYTVEKALDAAGNVSAVKLAKELQKNKPLAGGIKQAAEFGNRFKEVAKTPAEDSKWVSLMKKAVPIGGAGVGIEATKLAAPLVKHATLGLAGAAATAFTRPIARAAMKTDLYQRTLGKAREAKQAQAHLTQAAKNKRKAIELAGRGAAGAIDASQYNPPPQD